MAEPFVHKYNEFISNICDFYGKMSHINSESIIDVQKSYDNLISLAKNLEEEYNLEKAFSDPNIELSMQDIDVSPYKAEYLINARMYEVRKIGITRFKEKYLIKG